MNRGGNKLQGKACVHCVLVMRREGISGRTNARERSCDQALHMLWCMCGGMWTFGYTAFVGVQEVVDIWDRSRFRMPHRVVRASITATICEAIGAREISTYGDLLDAGDPHSTTQVFGSPHRE